MSFHLPWRPTTSWRRALGSLFFSKITKTKDGTELVVKTNEAFSEVAASAAKVGELVGEIAAASNEQAQGIEQINKAAVEMDEITQQNAANAAEDMSAQAEQMKAMVDELVALIGGNRKTAGHD